MVAIIIINGAGHCRVWVECHVRQVDAYIRTLPKNGWSFHKVVEL